MVDFKFELRVMWSNNGTVKDLIKGTEIQPHRTPQPEAGGSEGEDEDEKKEEDDSEDDDEWTLITFGYLLK